MAETEEPKVCRILSLDGGGEKGFYTLGVLKGIEGMVGPLHQRFDLIYGTSTGSIIAALIALGHPVDEILELYKTHVVEVMKYWLPSNKTAALKALAAEVFKDKDFTAIKTNVGIVATRWAFETPMIFKTSVDQAHGDKPNFVPGFGCKIADAVQASCSAYPFFKKKTVTTSGGEAIVLIDGGYCANNPTLYAIADATNALKLDRKQIRVVSVGVGEYPTPAEYTLKTFRTDVTAWLYKQYEGDLDTSGKKALRLKASGTRRSADILLVAPHKKYSRYYSERDHECVEGVLFITTDGTNIVNYPKQHSENMTRKHQATGEWLKPTVRIFKNMRNRLIRDGKIKSGVAPSYFIEGMLYNVPGDQFGVSYVNTVDKCWGWLNSPPNAGDLMCANGIHPLIRDNSHTSWPIQGYLDFLAETQKLWLQWK